MSLKNEVVEKLSEIIGNENVITSDEAIRVADPRMVRPYAKAFDYKPEHVPLCIAKVSETDHVSEILKYCNGNDIHVIVKTGASSSEDQLLVIDDRTIYLDAAPMDKILEINTENMTVTMQCGVPLAVIEEKANSMGYTLGHAPQSLPLASMGGLVATRSIGQFSTFYGGIEDLVCGMEGVLPNGEVFRIRPVPRRAVGPDLRHLIIGAEGAIAVMTEVTVKLFAWYPDLMWKGGYTVKDFETGLAMVREIMTKGYKPAVARVYDKADVDHHYGSVRLGEDEAFAFFSVEGPKGTPDVHGAAIHEIALKYGAKYIGVKAVDHWFENRNKNCDTIGTETEYKKFRETNVCEFPIEISSSWDEINDIYQEIKTTVPERIPNIAVFGGHVSHCYVNGTNIYFVASLKIDDPDNAHEEQYSVMDAICDVVLKHKNATIVHHHGVGKSRVRRIKEELGSSYPLLAAIKKTFDPNGIMNPGCLIPLD